MTTPEKDDGTLPPALDDSQVEKPSELSRAESIRESPHDRAKRHVNLPGMPEGFDNKNAPVVKADPLVSHRKEKETGERIPDGRGTPVGKALGKGLGSLAKGKTNNGFGLGDISEPRNKSGESSKTSSSKDEATNTLIAGSIDALAKTDSQKDIESVAGEGDKKSGLKGHLAGLNANKSSQDDDSRTLMSGPLDALKKRVSIKTTPAKRFVRMTLGAVAAVMLMLMMGMSSIFGVISTGASTSATTSASVAAIVASQCQAPNEGKGQSSSSVGVIDDLKGKTVGAYGEEHLTNAAHITRAANDAGMGSKGALLGIMTAMGESGLKVIDYGDDAGPDSRGLFQQRGNGAWGTYEDRMDPYISATNFFAAMKRNVPDWAQLAPTIAIHKTQINADPNHYAKYEDEAKQILAVVTGSSGSVSTGQDGKPVSNKNSAKCEDQSKSVDSGVGGGGYVFPIKGTNGESTRWGTYVGSTSHENGAIDIGAPGGAPIVAAANGKVRTAGWSDWGGNMVFITHSDGKSSGYLHMVEPPLVKEGQQIKAGQLLGYVGNTGKSFGEHLHFEISSDPQIRERWIKASVFMKSKGVKMGSCSVTDYWEGPCSLAE